jgi:hypothetical protein
MSNVISLEERRSAMRKARHTIGQCAAVKHAFVPTPAGIEVAKDADCMLRTHLMQEAFDEQQVEGRELSFERARLRVDEWMAQAGLRSLQFHEW